MSIKKLNKNGLYVIDDTFSEHIIIGDNIYAVLLLKNTQISYTFSLGKKSRLDFYGFFLSESPKNLFFHQEEPESFLQVRTLFFHSKNDLSSVVQSNINASNVKSSIEIQTIIPHGNIEVDASIDIAKNISGVQAHLKQKNIFVGNEGKMRGTPQLYVKSNDVQASHSCQVERIDSNILFYLTSRGLDENTAKLLILESYFIKMFHCLIMLDKNIYQNMYNDFVYSSKMK